MRSLVFFPLLLLFLIVPSFVDAQTDAQQELYVKGPQGDFYTVDVASPGETVVQVVGHVEATETPTVAPVGANKDGEAPSALGKKRLTLRERRAAGFTPDNIKSVRQQLIDGGFITSDTSRAEQAAMVNGVIVRNASDSTDPILVAIDWDNIDWDAIFAFIERLIALFMMFM